MYALINRLFFFLQSVRFALRRLSLGIPRGDLVLEIGSGNNPLPRANVLLDLTTEAFQRAGGKTIVDRPFLLAYADRLPFRDGAFDYVAAFHILEHQDDPEAFLA